MNGPLGPLGPLAGTREAKKPTTTTSAGGSDSVPIWGSELDGRALAIHRGLPGWHTCRRSQLGLLDRTRLLHG
jgi:hypothetical protein